MKITKKEFWNITKKEVNNPNILEIFNTLIFFILSIDYFLAGTTTGDASKAKGDEYAEM